MFSFVKKMSVRIFVGKKIRHFLRNFFLPIRYTVVFREEGGVGGCYNPSPLLRTVSDLHKILSGNVPNYRSGGQSRFTQQAAIFIFSCLACQNPETI